MKSIDSNQENYDFYILQNFLYVVFQSIDDEMMPETKKNAFCYELSLDQKFIHTLPSMVKNRHKTTFYRTTQSKKKYFFTTNYEWEKNCL